MTEQEELFAQADDLEASFADGAQWGSTYQSCTEDDEDELDKETDEGKQGAKALAITSRYLYRRAYGESKLFDILVIEPLKYGTATHVLTGGDIDMLSFLKYILRYQTVDWCILSPGASIRKTYYRCASGYCKGRLRSWTHTSASKSSKEVVEY